MEWIQLKNKEAVISMELSTFHVPPSGDILVLGKRCPLGPQAAKRMLDTVSLGQFELVQPKDEIVDAVLVKKYLFLRTEKESLIKAIVEESKAIMGSQCMISIKCETTVAIRRNI